MPDRSGAMHDVIVVGGGPAGLQVAALLARDGWDVLLYEEHAEAGEPIHCTGVLAAEAYDELDLPKEPILNTLSTMRFFAPSGETVSYTTSVAEAVVIDRRLFDRQLHNRAAETGVRIITGRRVTNVVAASAGVTVSLADGSEARSRACILACGANYVLQRRMGLGLPAVYLQSAQVEWPAAPLGTVEVHFGQDVAPGGFAWVVPVRRGPSATARIGLMCDRNAGPHFNAFIERIAPRWRIERPDDRHAPPEPRLKMLPLAPLQKTFTDRVLAVGDAAGLVKATTGGGIYYSLVSAGIAADVLGEALTTDSLTGHRLAEYQRLWRKRLGPELEAQLALRVLADRFTDEDINALFELARTDGIMPIVRRTARFNRHRELILSLFKHPPARRLLFRRFRDGRDTAAS